MKQILNKTFSATSNSNCFSPIHFKKHRIPFKIFASPRISNNCKEKKEDNNIQKGLLSDFTISNNGYYTNMKKIDVKEINYTFLTKIEDLNLENSSFVTQKNQKNSKICRNYIKEKIKNNDKFKTIEKNRTQNLFKINENKKNFESVKNSTTNISFNKSLKNIVKKNNLSLHNSNLNQYYEDLINTTLMKNHSKSHIPIHTIWDENYPINHCPIKNQKNCDLISNKSPLKISKIKYDSHSNLIKKKSIQKFPLRKNTACWKKPIDFSIHKCKSRHVRYRSINNNHEEKSGENSQNNESNIISLHQFKVYVRTKLRYK